MTRQMYVSALLGACLVATVSTTAMAVPLPGPVCTDVAVVNPSFESPDLGGDGGASATPPTGWTGTGLHADPLATQIAAEAYDGNQVWGGNSGDTLAQVLPGTLEEGAVYCLKVRVGTPDGTVIPGTSYSVRLVAIPTTGRTTIAEATESTHPLVSGAYVTACAETTPIDAALAGVPFAVVLENDSAAPGFLAFDLVEVKCCPKGQIPVHKFWASSVERNKSLSLGPQNALDGNKSTRWSTVNKVFSETLLGFPGAIAPVVFDQWLKLDLGEAFNICEIKICFERARSDKYLLEFSLDGCNWFDPFVVTDPTPYRSPSTFDPKNEVEDCLPIPNVCARWVRWQRLDYSPSPSQNVSIRELMIAGNAKCKPVYTSEPTNVLDSSWNVNVNQDPPGFPDQAPSSLVPEAILDGVPDQWQLASTNTADPWDFEHKSHAHGAVNPDHGVVAIIVPPPSRPLSFNCIKILWGLRQMAVDYRIDYHDGTGWQLFAEVDGSDGFYDKVFGPDVTTAERIRIVSQQRFDPSLSSGFQILEVWAFNCLPPI